MPTPTLRGGPAGKRPVKTVAATSSTPNPIIGYTPSASRAPPRSQPLAGKVAFTARATRKRKIAKDTIRGITRPDIRRLARRGGVKRISAGIYHEVRQALKDRVQQILQGCIIYTEYRHAKTVTISDVLFSLRRLGTPIYGFDPATFQEPSKRHAISKE